MVPSEVLIRLRHSLDALRNGMGELRDAIKDHTRAIHSRDEKQNRKAPVSPPIVVKVGFDEKTVFDFNKESERQYRTQKQIRNATRAAVIAAAIYAVISLLMWCQMIRQSKIANAALRQNIESFRIDERAWLGIPSMTPKAYAAKSGKFPAMFTYGIHLKNHGKTEAGNIDLRFSPSVIGSRQNANQPGIETFDQNKLLLGKIPSASGIPIFNAVPRDLAPGETTTVPVPWHGQAPSGNGWIVDYLIGRIDYTDAFGVKHWHTFCFFVGDAQGNMWNCKYGNKDDQNPELPPN